MEETKTKQQRTGESFFSELKRLLGRPEAKKTFFVFAAILIIGIGVFLRFWQLGSIPPGLQYDEAYNGLDAISAMESGDYKIFYPENFGREGLYINAIALLMKIFGISTATVRFASAFFGSVTLLGFFLLLRQMKFSTLSQLLGTLLLALSFWHLDFSRTVYRAIMVPMLIVWSLYFFLLALEEIKKCKNCFFAISGALLGLGLHTYISFRVAPLIFILLAVYLMISKKDFLRNYWQSAMIFLFSAFLVALPLFGYFLSHRADLTGRAGAVSVFNAPDMSFPRALGKSLAWHLGAFFVYGDPNQRHDHESQPIIPAAWSVIFALGLVLSSIVLLKTFLIPLFQERDKSYADKIRTKFESGNKQLILASFLGQSIFWVMLIPGVLSIEGIPHALRIIGSMVGVFIICLIPIESFLGLYQRVKKSTTLAYKPWRWNILKASFAGLVLIIVLGGASNAYLYFEIWAKSPKTASAFEKNLFDMGLVVNQLGIAKNNYLIVDSDIWVREEDHKDASIKTTIFSGYPKIKSYLFYKPLEGRFSVECENSQIVFQKADEWLLEQFKERCPDLEKQQISVGSEDNVYWILQSK